MYRWFSNQLWELRCDICCANGTKNFIEVCVFVKAANFTVRVMHILWRIILSVDFSLVEGTLRRCCHCIRIGNISKALVIIIVCNSSEFHEVIGPKQTLARTSSFSLNFSYVYVMSDSWIASLLTWIYLPRANALFARCFPYKRDLTQFPCWSMGHQDVYPLNWLPAVCPNITAFLRTKKLNEVWGQFSSHEPLLSPKRGKFLINCFDQ
jgi:hypothetical protein